MDTADAAGGKHFDAGVVGEDHGAGYGGAAAGGVLSFVLALKAKRKHFGVVGRQLTTPVIQGRSRRETF